MMIYNDLFIFDVPYICNDKLMFGNEDIKYLIKGEAVPYKTLWYNYGKNFVVLDYFCDFNQIYYFKDGKFDHLTEWRFNADTTKVKKEFYDFYYTFFPNVVDAIVCRLLPKINPDNFLSYYEKLRDLDISEEDVAKLFNATSTDYSIFGAYIYLLSNEEYYISEEFTEEFKNFCKNTSITLEQFYSWHNSNKEEIKLIEKVLNKYIGE